MLPQLHPMIALLPRVKPKKTKAVTSEAEDETATLNYQVRPKNLSILKKNVKKLKEYQKIQKWKPSKLMSDRFIKTIPAS